MKLPANIHTPLADDSQNVLARITSMEGPKRAGLFLFLLVFGVFGLWAGFAPLDGAAFAPGKVTVRSYKKVVQHLEGGIVEDILVRDGDRVTRGQTLLIIDDTQAISELEIARSQFLAYKAREARLIAERDGLDAVVYPEILSTFSPAANAEMQAQNQIFSARRQTIEGSYEILEQRVQQLENQVIGMRALRESKQLLATSYEEELADTQSLLDQGFSEKTRLREAERNFAIFSGEAAELTANIASTEIQIGETRLQILQQESEYINEVVSELGDTQTNINDLSERITALEDVVSRTVVTAPDSGIVNGMQVHTVGGVIGSGTAIAEIVPASDELIIEANVDPNDIDRVSEGQEARIRFSTFGSRAPTIFGSVLNLSADSMTNPDTGISFYLARIQVDPDSLAELGDLSLLPGMPAEVYINTGSRTFLQYLFKPLSNAMARSFNED